MPQRRRRPQLEPLESRALLASLGDYVWYDLDIDGVQDATEPGVPGAELRLYRTTDRILGNADDVQLALTHSDDGGHFRFDDVAAGNYYIQLVHGRLALTAGSTSGATVGEISRFHNWRTPLIEFSGATDNLTYDAGLVRGGSYIGYAFTDSNSNTWYDEGEPRHAGVRVYYDGNLDGDQDYNEPWVVTDERGLYEFKGMQFAGPEHNIKIASTHPWSPPESSVEPDFYVTANNRLYKYAWSGELLWDIAVPWPLPNGEAQSMTSMAVDPEGKVYLAQLSIETQLGGYISVFEPATSSWAHHYFDDRQEIGTLSIFGDYLYMRQNRIRWSDWSIERLPDFARHSRIGMDGVLYDTTMSYGQEMSISTAMGALTFRELAGPLGFAPLGYVDALGEAFAAMPDGSVRRYSPAAVLQTSYDAHQTPTGSLAVSRDGRFLVAAAHDDAFTIADRDFADPRRFEIIAGNAVNHGSVQVAFATYQGGPPLVAPEDVPPPANIRLATGFFVHEPRAASDDYVVAAGEVFSVAAAAGLLANDSDADGDVLRASLLQAAAHGVVTLRSDGSFDYQPAAGFIGEDSFRYAVDDAAGGTQSALVRIRVLAPEAFQAVTGVLTYDAQGDGSPDESLAVLGGLRLFLDLNHNGYREPHEPQTISNPDGSFAFSAVPPGEYSVVIDFASSRWRASDAPSTNIYVTLERELREYTLGGQLVHSWPVPDPPRPDRQTLGTPTVDTSGVVWFWQTSPKHSFLTRFDPATETWQHTTAAGINGNGKIVDGRFAVVGDELILGSLSVFSNGQFQPAADRGSEQSNFGGFVLGHDGRLYSGGGNSVKIVFPGDDFAFDSFTISAPPGINYGVIAGVAAAADGTVFVATAEGWVLKLDRRHQVIASRELPPEVNSFTSLALNGDGTLVLGDRFGNVCVLGSDLQLLHRWQIASYNSIALDFALHNHNQIVQQAVSVSSEGEVGPIVFEVTRPPAPWQNLQRPEDIDRDGLVSAVDAVMVINALNASGPGPLPSVASGSVRWDVNGDNYLSPLDALLVINRLNATGNGEAETAPFTVQANANADAALVWLAYQQAWEAEQSKRSSRS